MPLEDTTELLDECKELLVERGLDYGDAHDHHSRTAYAFWAITGHCLDADEVALFFAVDKMVRRMTSPDKRDHYADIVNYVGLAWGHRQQE